LLYQKWLCANTSPGVGNTVSGVTDTAGKTVSGATDSVGKTAQGTFSIQEIEGGMDTADERQALARLPRTQPRALVIPSREPLVVLLTPVRLPDLVDQTTLVCPSKGSSENWICGM